MLSSSSYYPLSLFITLLYSFLCLLSLVQLCRILYYKHNIRSFHFAFLLCTFTWSLFRCIFFGSWASLSSVFSLILFWFPVDIQFATFSLIVVYYAYLLYKHNWNRRRKFIFAVYGVINISIFILTCMYIYVSCFKSSNNNTSNIDSASNNNNNNNPDNFNDISYASVPAYKSVPLIQISSNPADSPSSSAGSAADSSCVVSEWLERTHHLYMFFQFVLLLSVYGYYLYKLHQQAYKVYTPLTIVSLLVWFCFLSRCIYCLFAAFSVYSIEIGGNYGGIKQVGVLAFVLLFCWEILPMSVFLLYFRHIPKGPNYNDANYYLSNLNNYNYSDLDTQASLLGLSRRDSVGAAIASIETDLAAVAASEGYVDDMSFSFSPQNHGLFYTNNNLENLEGLGGANNNLYANYSINQEYFQSSGQQLGPEDNGYQFNRKLDR
jgi:uncharacterized membrane protein